MKYLRELLNKVRRRMAPVALAGLLFLGLCAGMCSAEEAAPVVAAAAAVTSWGALFVSGPAIVLYIGVVLFVFHWLQKRYQWDTERWEGIVANAFLLAEKSGVGAAGKLGLAIQSFNQQYQATYGKEPSPLDLKDAAADFARLALKLKMAQAPALAAAEAVQSGT